MKMTEEISKETHLEMNNALKLQKLQLEKELADLKVLYQKQSLELFKLRQDYSDLLVKDRFKEPVKTLVG